MIIDPARIANAFVELALTAKSSEIPVLIEAVLSRLDRKSLRSFPRHVRTALQARSPTVTIRATLPSAKTHPAEELVFAAIEKRLKKPVVPERTADPSLLGGMQVNIGDDAFDYSVRGALDVLERHLALPASS